MRTSGTQRIENWWHTEDRELVAHRGLRTGGAQRVDNLAHRGLRTGGTEGEELVAHRGLRTGGTQRIEN